MSDCIKHKIEDQGAYWECIDCCDRFIGVQQCKPTVTTPDTSTEALAKVDRPTTDRLAEIEACCETATEGPWRDGQPGNFRIYGPGNMGAQSGPIAEALGVQDFEIQRGNARFIAHARTDIPYLIARIRQLEANLQECVTVRRVDEG